MKPRSELAALLRSARRTAFERAPKNTDRDYGRTVALEQVRLVLERSQAIGKTPFPQKEAVLDRALQKYSKNYLLTRKLAAQLKIRLDPKEVRAGLADYYSWDPGRAVVDYTPLESRLRECLSRSGAKGGSWNEFDRLRLRIRPLYHELNHAVLFRAFRPSGEILRMPDSALKRRHVRHYYALVESMVIFRDILIAEELGELAWPFIQSGALYFGLKDGIRTRRFMNFDRFVSCLLHMQWQVLGRRSREIQRFFAEAGRKFVYHSYFSEFNDRSFGLHRKWFERYLRTHRAEFRLPAPTAALKPL
ncbi:MAG: hypothetical protein ACXVBW_06390, partial [Bdellovibrionota bacterium]